MKANINVQVILPLPQLISPFHTEIYAYYYKHRSTSMCSTEQGI